MPRSPTASERPGAMKSRDPQCIHFSRTSLRLLGLRREGPRCRTENAGFVFSPGEVQPRPSEEIRPGKSRKMGLDPGSQGLASSGNAARKKAGLEIEQVDHAAAGLRYAAADGVEGCNRLHLSAFGAGEDRLGI